MSSTASSFSTSAVGSVNASATTTPVNSDPGKAAATTTTEAAVVNHSDEHGATTTTTTTASPETNNNNNHNSDDAKSDSSVIDLTALIPPRIPTALSTSSLETRLRQLRQSAVKHSQILTLKLSSSQSGQSLLHMGTNLSTLPPQLHALLSQLHPLVSTVETAEKQQLHSLEQLVQRAQNLHTTAQRVQQARAAAQLVADLTAAERILKQLQQQMQRQRQQEQLLLPQADDDGATFHLDLETAASLERVAYIANCLVEDVEVANERVRTVTSSNTATTTTAGAAAAKTTAVVVGGGNLPIRPSMTILQPSVATEAAQLVLKLGPRIRAVESQTMVLLAKVLEQLLAQMHTTQTVAAENSNNHGHAENGGTRGEQEEDDNDDDDDITFNALDAAAGSSSLAISSSSSSTAVQKNLVLLGHVVRGLAILGRGSDVESIFARVAVMPLIRAQVSVGRLDQGGPRGECTGLPSLLQNLIASIRQTYGPALLLAQEMFDFDDQQKNGDDDSASTAAAASTSSSMSVDLLTAGIWVPIATALMADTAIRMAIFSPGIASILQTNYVAVDDFLATLAQRALGTTTTKNSTTTAQQSSAVQRAQARIYAHPKTVEFAKRWNLPIYYQLRFGEACNRLNKAIERTQKEGWSAQVFSGSEERATELKNTIGFELSFFLEVYDILMFLWRKDVILRPLTNRFLRGSVQILGRTLAFIQESMDGKIKFGQEPQQQPKPTQPATPGGMPPAPTISVDDTTAEAPPLRRPYCWGESEDDVAAVAWELTILESAVKHDYADTVCSCLTPVTDEMSTLVSEVLGEASDPMQPVIEKAWKELIVKLLTAKCSAPLSNVKGVAVMYRMTNRPPPTQASGFVPTIYRPLLDFSRNYNSRTPVSIGNQWKQPIVVSVSEKYAAAVKELLTTVQRTEEALKHRKAAVRRLASGGMSDGEKLKLQLYLDFVAYQESVVQVGVDPKTVLGISKLQELTLEGHGLFQQGTNPIQAQRKPI